MRSLLLVVLSILLIGCGGAEVEQNPPPPVQDNSTNYNGPAPQTDDIQQFKLNLWDNLVADNRCGSCHQQGNTAPFFVRRDDINQAYAAVLPLVNLADPAQSVMVQKVAGGHNCWLSSNTACADTISQWLRNWGNTTDAEQAAVALVAPVIRDPGASKALPESPGLFAAEVYPLLRQYCANCHAPDVAVAQAPFFAAGDVDTAYQASRNLINLDRPELSRLVARLGGEFHNCWSDCSNDAAAMLAAVVAISEAVPVTELDPQLVPSKALRLEDGVVASSGGRFESNQIAFYQFKEGQGNQAFDTSGVEPAANLTLQGDFAWLTGWGLQINSGRAQASTLSSAKLASLIGATGEMSIEAWVIPANVVQEGPAAIVSYAGSAISRNFTLGQSQYNYDFLLRSANSDFAGMPALSTADADELLQASLQHVVLTQDPVNGQRIYVNGEDSGVQSEPAAISSWDDSFALMLGNEADGSRQWQGSIRLLAIHNRALSPAQIAQNFSIGVGQKFYLPFAIGHLIDLPQSYIVFEVAQFDNYSYLFSQPYLINLDDAALPANLEISDMALAINGREVNSGQAWIRQDFNFASGTNLSEAVPMSELGTIIAAEAGAASDEFFLSFGQIGQYSNVRSQPAFPAQQVSQANTNSSDIGIRPFAAIHASMSELTGVSQASPAIANTYQTITRQLPALSDIETFISAQQMAITQLGIAYCNAAINDPMLRSQWFPTVNFNASPAEALSPANRDALISPLLARFAPLQPLTALPDPDARAELNNLIDRLSQCDGACDSQRTETIAKAACTAVLASAQMLVY
ncbi:Concanavalin A-like lectin/glucanases superfamily protein [Arsukibacterium tuosuense]|uniref:Concanavalin A-like lectin/glucanases superfamily protein n=1 Tax=Arsukibacterium tuosuense TaxID=1323745 RepID=A0A285J2F5_9GAMM|nr:LamG domain-containing protein [Arsukibacterium tuosuense]SNY53321.1 Concanavalin A-like lectin/glucanases superfamily protein [Arsukibacterium tuosuense]